MGFYRGFLIMGFFLLHCCDSNNVRRLSSFRFGFLKTLTLSSLLLEVPFRMDVLKLYKMLVDYNKSDKP